MGASGEKREKLITWEEILEKTRGGWDVFCKEIGKFPVSRAFKHPLKKDNDPSGSIVQRGGVWFLCDFGKTFPTMTALQFIQRKYGLNYKGAIEKMAIDFGLLKKAGVYVPIEIDWGSPVEYEERELHIGFSGKKWRKEQHEFWKGTDVNEELCMKKDVYAVKDLAINRRRVAIKEDEVVWAYYAKDIDKVKIYFPQRQKKDRFKGNVPGNYIWGINDIGGCEKLIVQKSRKDELCTLVVFPCVVSVQSENAAIFTDAVVDKIHNLAKEVWVAFGSDKQGVEQSTLLSERHNWKWVNPPSFLLPEINDTYSLEKAHGVKAWEECLKAKNII